MHEQNAEDVLCVLDLLQVTETVHKLCIHTTLVALFLRAASGKQKEMVTM
jgi:hypothetical protein